MLVLRMFEIARRGRRGVVGPDGRFVGVVEQHAGLVGLGVFAHRLHGEFGDALLDFRAAHLQRRDLRSRGAALGHGREHAQLAHLQRLDLQVDVGDLCREGRIVGQGAAIQRLGAGDLAQHRDAALGGRDLGDAQPLVGQQELGAGPALVLLADQVLDRDLHIVEEHVVHVMGAVGHYDRPHGDARRLHVDQQEGDALLRLHLGVGPAPGRRSNRPNARTRSRSSGR